jgi:N-ethylmaleimide reductase
VSLDAIGYINTAGIHTDEQVEGWKKVTNVFMIKAGKSLFNSGMAYRTSCHPDFHNGALPLSASAINPNDKAFTPEGFKVTVTPEEMTVEDIKTTVKDFQNAAINAVKQDLME